MIPQKKRRPLDCQGLVQGCRRLLKAGEGCLRLVEAAGLGFPKKNEDLSIAGGWFRAAGSWSKLLEASYGGAKLLETQKPEVSK